jgi:hypothetical protein
MRMSLDQWRLKPWMGLSILLVSLMDIIGLLQYTS